MKKSIALALFCLLSFSSFGAALIEPVLIGNVAGDGLGDNLRLGAIKINHSLTNILGYSTSASNVLSISIASLNSTLLTKADTNSPTLFSAFLSGGVTVRSSLSITGATPTVFLQATNAPANHRRWRWVVDSSGTLALNSYNDAEDATFQNITITHDSAGGAVFTLNTALVIPNGAASGYVWTSDADGLGSWAISSGGSGGAATNAVTTILTNGVASTTGSIGINYIGSSTISATSTNRNRTNDIAFNVIAVPYSIVSGTPTTVAGAGLTDAATTTQLFTTSNQLFSGSQSLNLTLPNTSREIAAGRPLRILSLGDSFALYPALHMNDAINFLMRSNGAQMTYGSTFNLTYNGSATNLSAVGSTNWYGLHLRLGTNAIDGPGTITFTNFVNANQVGMTYGNKLSVIYRLDSGAGSFYFQSRTNGGAWTTQALVSTAGPIGAGTNVITVPLGWWQCRAVFSNAPSIIIGLGIENSTARGLVISSIAMPGDDISSMRALSTNLWVPVLRQLNPSLITWWAQDSSNAIATNVIWLRDLLTMAGIKSDFIAFASTPAAAGDNNGANMVWREMARTNENFGYFDAWTLFTNYTVITNKFGTDNGDGTHLPDKAQQFFTDGFMAQSGLLGMMQKTAALFRDRGQFDTPLTIGASDLPGTFLRHYDFVTGLNPWLTLLYNGELSWGTEAGGPYLKISTSGLDGQPEFDPSASFANSARLGNSGARWREVWGNAIINTNFTNLGTINIPIIGASKILITDANSNVTASAATPTQLGYLSTATGDIQAQISLKQAILTNNNSIFYQILTNGWLKTLSFSGITPTEQGGTNILLTVTAGGSGTLTTIKTNGVAITTSAASLDFINSASVLANKGTNTGGAATVSFDAVNDSTKASVNGGTNATHTTPTIDRATFINTNLFAGNWGGIERSAIGGNAIYFTNAIWRFRLTNDLGGFTVSLLPVGWVGIVTVTNEGAFRLGPATNAVYSGNTNIAQNAETTIVFRNKGGSIEASIIGDTNQFYYALGPDVAVSDGGTGISSGTSGGVLAFTASGTIASSGALAANALVIGGGAGVAPSTTTTGAGILTFIGTPSSANLLAAVTDETGSGALVFGTAPQLSTIELGNASDTTLSRSAAGLLAVEGNILVSRSELAGSNYLTSATPSGAATKTFYNFTLNTPFTNTSGQTLDFFVPVDLHAAAVNGASALDVMANDSGASGMTNYARSAMSTLITSISMDYTNLLVFSLQQGGFAYATNTSTGAGNSAAIISGGYYVPRAGGTNFTSTNLVAQAVGTATQTNTITTTANEATANIGTLYLTNGQYRTIDVPAGAMISNITLGATFTSLERFSPTNRQDDVFIFADGTTNLVSFSIAMPEEWDRSTVKVKFLWTTTNSIATQTNVWGISATAISHDDVMTADWGTEQVVNSPVTAADDLLVSPATSALTVAGTPQVGDLVYFRVRRLGGSANDAMSNAQARLLHVVIQYREAAGTGATAW